MIKWFIITITVLLGIIVALAWQLKSVSAPSAPSSTQSVVTSSPLLANAQTLSEPQVRDLFHKRGCVNCHDSQNTLVGPSFTAIAERYQMNEHAQDILLTSLRQGSQGKWGDIHVMPMNTEAAVSDSEANAMISWILASSK